jgi:hypothetical protein
MCRTFRRGSVWRLAFGVRRLAVGGWRLGNRTRPRPRLGTARGSGAVFRLAAIRLKHISRISPIDPICRASARVVRGRAHATDRTARIEDEDDDDWRKRRTPNAKR